MFFVNNKMWSATDDMPGDPNNPGIQNYNLGPVGHKTTTAVPHALEIGTNEIPWLYANTLLDQKFNKFGFYEPETNEELIKIGVPNSLRSRINNIQQFSTSYLFEPSTVKYNGVVPIKDKPNMYTLAANNGMPKTVLTDPVIIYNQPLILSPNGKNGQLVPNLDYQRESKPIGFIRE